MKRYWLVLFFLLSAVAFAGEADVAIIADLAIESASGSTRGYLGNEHVNLDTAVQGDTSHTRGYVGDKPVRLKTRVNPDGTKTTTGYVGNEYIRVKNKKN